MSRRTAPIKPSRRRSEVPTTETQKPTKRKKRKRTVKPKIPGSLRACWPLGGFIPQPPKECVYQIENEGVCWVDQLLCEHCANEKNCFRRKEFTKELKQRGWGVISKEIKKGEYVPGKENGL